MNAGRLAGDGITHQRDQARVPGAGAKRAIGMEAQAALADVLRQNAEIDAADLGEIARGQRAGDRPGAVPPFQRVRRALGVVLLARSRNDRPVPVVEDVLRLGIFNALNAASASRHGHRTRHSRSNNSGRGRYACSVWFRRGTGTAPCGWPVRALRAVDQVGEINLGLDIRRVDRRRGRRRRSSGGCGCCRCARGQRNDDRRPGRNDDRGFRRNGDSPA